MSDDFIWRPSAERVEHANAAKGLGRCRRFHDAKLSFARWPNRSGSPASR